MYVCKCNQFVHRPRVHEKLVQRAPIGFKIRDGLQHNSWGEIGCRHYERGSKKKTSCNIWWQPSWFSDPFFSSRCQRVRDVVRIREEKQHTRRIFPIPWFSCVLEYFLSGSKVPLIKTVSISEGNKAEEVEKSYEEFFIETVSNRFHFKDSMFPKVWTTDIKKRYGFFIFKMWCIDLSTRFLGLREWLSFNTFNARIVWFLLVKSWNPLFAIHSVHLMNHSHKPRILVLRSVHGVLKNKNLYLLLCLWFIHFGSPNLQNGISSKLFKLTNNKWRFLDRIF